MFQNVLPVREVPAVTRGDRRLACALRQEVRTRHYWVSMSSSLVPCPARRLFLACSMRRKRRGSCSRRYSNQSFSRFEAYQHAGGIAVARDDIVLSLRLSKKVRRIRHDL